MINEFFSSLYLNNTIIVLYPILQNIASPEVPNTLIFYPLPHNSPKSSTSSALTPETFHEGPNHPSPLPPSQIVLILNLQLPKTPYKSFIWAQIVLILYPPNTFQTFHDGHVKGISAMLSRRSGRRGAAVRSAVWPHRAEGLRGALRRAAGGLVESTASHPGEEAGRVGGGSGGGVVGVVGVLLLRRRRRGQRRRRKSGESGGCSCGGGRLVLGGGSCA